MHESPVRPSFHSSPHSTPPPVPPASKRDAEKRSASAELAQFAARAQRVHDRQTRPSAGTSSWTDAALSSSPATFAQPWMVVTQRGLTASTSGTYIWPEQVWDRYAPEFRQRGHRSTRGWPLTGCLERCAQGAPLTDRFCSFSVLRLVHSEGGTRRRTSAGRWPISSRATASATRRLITDGVEQEARAGGPRSHARWRITASFLLLDSRRSICAAIDVVQFPDYDARIRPGETQSKEEFSSCPSGSIRPSRPRLSLAHTRRSSRRAW
jgi:hypothetical protein